MCSSLHQKQKTFKWPNANDVEIAEQSQDWTLHCSVLATGCLSWQQILSAIKTPLLPYGSGIFRYICVRVCARAHSCRYDLPVLYADVFLWKTWSRLLSALNNLMHQCIFIQDDATHTQEHMPRHSLSSYYRCAHCKPSVCKSVTHNFKRHGADIIEGGIRLFDCWDTWRKNKLMCHLQEQVSCICCRVFDLLQTWELPSTCVGYWTLFKGTLIVDVEEEECISHLLRGPLRNQTKDLLATSSFL